jgi:hypothetical protein
MLGKTRDIQAANTSYTASKMEERDGKQRLGYNARGLAEDVHGVGV